MATAEHTAARDPSFAAPPGPLQDPPLPKKKKSCMVPDQEVKRAVWVGIG